jgi:adenylate kinase
LSSSADVSSYVVFGLPGSGKGTLSQFIKQHGDVQHVNSGDLLRSEVEKSTAIGSEIKSQLAVGHGVDSSIVTKLVIAVLEPLCKENKRFILDGFPQNWEQRLALEGLFARYPDLHVQFIVIEVEKKTALQRMASRFSCVKCTRIFNYETRIPKEAGKCDECHGALKHRDADSGQLAKDRLKTFKQTTGEVIGWYKDRGALILDGNQPLDACLADYASRFKVSQQ